MSKLLALDQSSRITGYAIFDGNQLVSYGKFSLDDDDIGARLVKFRNKIQSLIEDNQINEVVFEDIQMQNNVINNIQTFKILAEIFGIVYELVTEMKIKNSAVLASVWKSTLGIKGRTRPEQKKNAQNYVINTFSVKPTQDECDAICIGLHHLSHSNDIENFDWSD